MFSDGFSIYLIFVACRPQPSNLKTQPIPTEYEFLKRHHLDRDFYLRPHLRRTRLHAARVVQTKNIGSTFAWLIILFLFPVFGTIAYILIGEPRLGTARAKRTGEMNRFYRNFAATHLADIYLDIADQVKSRYHGISKVAEKGTGLGATKGNAMSLLPTTDAIIDSMLTDIRAATHSCLLAFYIIEPKGRIEEILNEILAAADRGVDCAILADAVGSRSFLKVTG